MAAALVLCNELIGQCITEDIAKMYGQFHLGKAQFGAKMLKLHKEKAWLIHPPLHLNKTK
jgi:Protein of unknown function (DUF3231)